MPSSETRAAQIRRYYAAKRLRNFFDYGVSHQGAQMQRYVPIEYISESEYFRGIIYLGNSRSERVGILSRAARANIMENAISSFWHYCIWPGDYHSDWNQLEMVCTNWLIEQASAEPNPDLWKRGDSKEGSLLAFRLRELSQRHQALIRRRQERLAKAQAGNSPFFAP